VCWLFNDAVTTRATGVGRSQFRVHTDERTQVHSAQPSLAVTHNFSERVTELALVATAPLKIGKGMGTFDTGDGWDGNEVSVFWGRLGDGVDTVD
jgi:hypothetical protein